MGRYVYTLRAWIDRFLSWRKDLAKRVEAGQQVTMDLLMGGQILDEVLRRASEPDLKKLSSWLKTFRASGKEREKIQLALSDEFAAVMARYPEDRLATTYEKELSVVVDPVKARFSTWYEMFPRSSSPGPGEHGSFRDCEARLPYVAAMGFDVLYFPRFILSGGFTGKGKITSPTPKEGEVGSPWAIGAEEGGHKAVHPQLGTLEDFQRLCAKAKESGIEIALDIAFQCAPDHPYTKEHPEWFRWRPDGTVQYAENPPKKYEDIIPFRLSDCPLAGTLGGAAEYRLFLGRAGRPGLSGGQPPHQALSFLGMAHRNREGKHPEVIFLSEAFTRPNVMLPFGQMRFHAVIQLFRLEKHQMGDHPVFHRIE